MSRIALACVGSIFAVGCASSALPDGVGRGIVSADATPPDGAAVYAKPVWKAGDRYVFRRAAAARLPLTVVEVPGGYGLSNDESGALALYSSDFGEIGEELPGDAGTVRRQEPADALVHWPLWVGKRWTCHILRKAPGEPALPLLVTYHCDAQEQVTVPAGTYRCLRIWRRVRVAAEGAFLERASLLWYAPEVGFFARRLESGTLVELEEVHRPR